MACDLERAGWRPLVAQIVRQAPMVVLWLEEDLRPEKIKQRGHPAMPIADELKGNLSWLTNHVLVVNQQKPLRELDIQVRNLADRVYNLREIVYAGEQNKTYISMDDFRSAWAATPQAAGKKLAELLDKGFLRRVAGKNERYTAGPEWERFHEDPSGESA